MELVLIANIKLSNANSVNAVKYKHTCINLEGGRGINIFDKEHHLHVY